MSLKPTKPSKEARNKRKAEQRKNPPELRKAALNSEAQREHRPAPPPLLAHQRFGH